jgi:hypothetical protein
MLEITRNKEPITIVGIGCRFPGANGPAEYDARKSIPGDAEAGWSDGRPGNK